MYYDYYLGVRHENGADGSDAPTAFDATSVKVSDSHGSRPGREEWHMFFTGCPLQNIWHHPLGRHVQNSTRHWPKNGKLVARPSYAARHGASAPPRRTRSV